jgi:hypothetical protein
MMPWQSRTTKTAGVAVLWLASLAGAYLFGTARDPGGPAADGGKSAGGFNSGRASSQSTPANPPGSAAGKTGTSLKASGSAARPSVAGSAGSTSAGAFLNRLTALRAEKPGPLQRRALLDAIAAMAERDPAAAMAAAGEETGLKLRADLRATVLQHWAQTDPEKAWAFALANTSGELPDNRLDLVLDGVARGNPQTALRFLQDHGDVMGRRFERAATVIGDLFEAGHQDLITQWAETLPAGKLRDAAQTRLIDRWARYDPEAARGWMDANIKDPAALASARSELAASWARISPEAALQWADTLPASQRGRDLYGRIYAQWIDYDRNAAGAALAAQPASPELDKSIERYAYEVMRGNPADTMPWAESIGDKDRRWRAVERVALEWRRRDPDGLRNYLDASQFTEDQKRRLLDQ